MKYLIDSDFLVALYKPSDFNHILSKKIFKTIENSELIGLNLVFQESTTVISKQMGMVDAKKFHGLILKLVGEQILLDEDIENVAWKIFLQQNKKGTSFVDCANLATLEKYKLDGILSFDKFYPKDKLVYPKETRSLMKKA